MVLLFECPVFESPLFSFYRNSKLISMILILSKNAGDPDNGYSKGEMQVGCGIVQTSNGISKVDNCRVLEWSTISKPNRFIIGD